MGSVVESETPIFSQHSLEPQLVGCLLLVLLITCEVHPQLFLKEIWKCEGKFTFPKHDKRCASLWPSYYITYSTLGKSVDPNFQLL